MRGPACDRHTGPSPGFPGAHAQGSLVKVRGSTCGACADALTARPRVEQLGEVDDQGSRTAQPSLTARRFHVTLRERASAPSVGARGHRPRRWRADGKEWFGAVPRKRPLWARDERAAVGVERSPASNKDCPRLSANSSLARSQAPCPLERLDSPERKSERIRHASGTRRTRLCRARLHALSDACPPEIEAWKRTRLTPSFTGNNK